MHVDASNVPGSSILAIVATLASVALLSFSLRLYTRGRLLRSLGTDDWLLLVAALSTIGVLAITVVVVASKQTWQTNRDGQTVSILVWVLALVHVLGISFVKLSVALTVLRLAVRGWHRHTTLGCICLTTVLTVLWFGSALLFGSPITVHWSSTSDPEDIWELLGFINSVLDVIAGVFIVVLPLPLLSILRPSLSIRLVLFVVYAAATAAVVAATIRTYYLYTSWLNSVIDDSAAHTTLWSSIELTLGLLAASASTLQPLLASTGEHIRDHRNKTHNTKHFSASSVSTPRPYPSESYTSTSTVIHRPNAPRLLSLRYHDDESNLDFDIETPQRTRTHTLRTRGAHSRNVSDWSQFSGFTYYTTTAASVHEASPRRSRVVSVGEMEMRTRNIGVGSAGDRGGNGNIGIAVTTLSGRPVRDEEGGEEMAELKRLFADKSKDWGWGIERSGRTSVRTSVTTEGPGGGWYKHGYMGDGR